MGVPIVNATGVMLPVDAADALLFLVENCAVVVCASPTPAHNGLLWGAMSAGVPVVMAEGNPLGQLWAGWRLPVVMYGGSGGVVGAPSTLTPDLLYWGWWENLLQHGVDSAGWVGREGKRGAWGDVLVIDSFFKKILSVAPNPNLVHLFFTHTRMCTPSVSLFTERLCFARISLNFMTMQ